MSADLASLHRRLLGRLDGLTAWLGIGSGRRAGNRWEGGGAGARIEIKLHGAAAGAWGAWSAGASGRNLVGLIAHRRGVAFGAAIGLAYEFLGEADPGDDGADDPAPPVAAAGRGIVRARTIAARLRSIHGTVAEIYLTQTRGIPRPAGGWPAAIGFDPVTRALCGVVTDDVGDVVAVQRIFLTPDGRKVAAAEAEARGLVAVKRTDGPKSTGALYLGESGTDPLLICEGLESGLAVYASTGREVLVTLGPLSHLRALPPGREYIVCVEDDAPESQAAKSTAARLARWADDGAALSLAWPWPERRADKSDLADTMLQLGPAAVAARIDAAEPMCARPSPRRTNLPAYYPGPTEPRDAAIARQSGIIQRAIAAGVRLAVLRLRVRDRRAELLAGIVEPTAGEKAAATRHASAEINGGPLPEAARVLITGNQGAGKTTCAIAAVAAIRDPVTVWITEPNLQKAEEVAADYRKAAGPDSLPVRVVRGRGAIDPARESATMCERAGAAAAVARAGLSVRERLCPACPAAARCGYLRQERAIAAMQGGAVFVMSAAYLFLPSPAPTADMLIVDEDAAMRAVEVVEMPLAELDPYAISNIGIDARGTLAAIGSALKKPDALAIMQAANIGAASIKGLRVALNARLDALAPKFDGTSQDADIIAALDLPELHRIRATLALLSAIRRELDMPRPGFNAIRCNGENLTISYLRKPHGVKKAAILALDGTGNPDLARHVFGDRLEHHRIAVDRQAHVIGTRGKSYSRQSITGLDRNGRVRSPKLAAEAAQLRADIATVAKQLPGAPLIVASKAAIGALEPADDAPAAHFGALRGLNCWERTRSAVIVGRESISVTALEAQARAFLARDPLPLLPAAGYAKATRMRRMRDGTLSPVEVDLHPDPRVQAVLEQIREAECVQAIDRLRPVWHRREYALLNALALDVTYDVIRTHVELVAGGQPLELAYLATGILPLGARDLCQLNPKLFATVVAASRALAKYPPPPNKNSIWRRGVFCYRRHGQRGRDSRALVDLARHPDPRAAIEAALGPLAAFQGVRTVPPAPDTPIARAAGPRPTGGGIAGGAWIAAAPHGRPLTHAPPHD